MIKRTSPNSSSRKKVSSFPLRTSFRRKPIDKQTGGYDDKRPVMAQKDRQKTRYKIPKVSKTEEESISLSKRPTSDNKHAAAKDTSWGGVAEWYDKHLEKGNDTYHDKVVHPNLLRMLGDIKGKQILDLACGQGIFSRLLADKGAHVIGVDLGKELITLAEKKNEEYKFKVHYFHSSSDDLYMVKDETKDIVVCVLALQNIEKLQATVAEVSRVLKKGGKFITVLNHPSFRNPRHTHWGYDEHEKVQYRRVDEYLSESKIKIDMTPGSRDEKKFTVSFHRPLQVYIKALGKSGLAVTRLEEWESHKESERGPKKAAEDKSRKEIPLFMALEMVKIGDE